MVKMTTNLAVEVGDNVLKTRVRLQNALPDHYDVLSWEHKDEQYNDVACYMIARNDKVLWAGYPDYAIIVLIESEDDGEELCPAKIVDVVFK